LRQSVRLAFLTGSISQWFTTRPSHDWRG
jgi:hypothetical protein